MVSGSRHADKSMTWAQIGALERCVTEFELPIKKSVSLTWQGKTLDFDVAQELFSSHQVDRGSRMLLDTLDLAGFPARGSAADFGCGYGVLGIAWQAVFPEWSMAYVDRDALAVAFTRHNVAQVDGEARDGARYECDISLPYKDAGYDLVLWNVPGKAGRAVIAGLLDVVLDSLAPGGVLAAVIVHPLADLFAGELTRDDVAVTLTERGKEHTVVHIRRTSGQPMARTPFEDGLFNRPPQAFAVGDLAWELVPVIGLPEYESLSHATELAAKALISVAHDTTVATWEVIDPGAGHLAVVANLLWPEAAGEVYGRDALAIRTTARAIEPDASVKAETVWGVPGLHGHSQVEVIVAALPEQAQVDELGRLLDAIRAVLAPDGAAVLHGRSTEIARIERLIRRDAELRARKAEKLRGFAAVTARRG